MPPQEDHYHHTKSSASGRPEIRVGTRAGGRPKFLGVFALAEADIAYRGTE